MSIAAQFAHHRVVCHTAACRASTSPGASTKDRIDIESLTDALAEATYHGLEPLELDQLIALLEPISRRLAATGSK